MRGIDGKSDGKRCKAITKVNMATRTITALDENAKAYMQGIS